MRMSKMFAKTLRDTPKEAESIGYAALLRAGYITQLGAGIFTLLPLGFKAIKNIEKIIREEMDAIGAQEMAFPVVQTADIWKETGRFYSIDKELTKFKDRYDRDMTLAMTCEEASTDLFRTQIDSYKRLPQLIYQINTKWRDDARPRAGLIRVREFSMKDSYSFDKDEEGLKLQYEAHYHAYKRIFERCKLPIVIIQSDSGMMGGKVAHEYMYLSKIGEDTIIHSPHYIANKQVATFIKDFDKKEKLKELELVKTPNAKTIDEVCALLNISKKKTAKALFSIATFIDEETNEEKESFVLSLIRGDYDIEENKLLNFIKANSLRPAHPEEIIEHNIIPGFGSAINVKDVIVVVDDSVSESTNLVCGANKEGYHYLNSNFKRDYQGMVADIASAKEGYLCPISKEPLSADRGVEVANIFQLGTRYSYDMQAFYQDEKGERKPVVMGSYGIGVGRVLACLAEEYSDDKGLSLPINIAPYKVHFVSLIKDEKISDALYQELEKVGISTLYDDRKEQPGVKFADADLLGSPIRLTLGNKSLKENNIEVKLRSNLDETIIVSLSDISSWLLNKIKELG